MKPAHFLSVIALGAILTTTIAFRDNAPLEVEPSAAENEELSLANDIAHGKYLVGIMGCNDCHSPKRMGPSGPEVIPELLLSGYPAERPVIHFDSPLLKEGFGIFYPDLTAAAGPWGITFAGNLTPDATGIGNWSEEQFKVAMTKGRFKGLENGRMLRPPMPWSNYTEMTDEDLGAMFKYLQSISPVNNVVPPPVDPKKM